MLLNILLRHHIKVATYSSENPEFLHSQITKICCIQLHSLSTDSVVKYHVRVLAVSHPDAV